MSVLFATATEWVASLTDAQRQGQLAEKLRWPEWIPLLVVDEVGHVPCDPQAANLMSCSSPAATSTRA